MPTARYTRRPKALGPALRCTAHKTKTGEPCKAQAIRGGNVCLAHGGRTRHVKRAAAKRYAETLANLIDPDRALREATSLAYSDITKLYDEQGRLLPMSKWPPELAAAVSSYETETVRGNLDKGDGQFDEVLKTKLKLWDKPKNLEILFKHLGLLIERLHVTGSVGLDERIKSARKRVDGAARE